MRFGIDLGGSKIEIIALDDDDQEVLRQRVATPQNDYAATLAQIAGLVQDAEQKLGAVATVGIGTPGAIAPRSGLLKNSNSVCLNGMPIKQDLEHRLQRPLRIANDADCFALSEAMDGAGKGANSVFGVIIGTGVGAGIVINGALVSGPNAIAGEWGHNPLPWPADFERPGPACYCGKQGCIETFLSGPGMAADYLREEDAALSSREIVEKADEGEPAAIFALDRYLDRISRALAHVINILDPEVIVLGGGMSNVQSLYREVPLRWGKYVFSDRVDTRLVQNLHGDSSGVRGAAWLWPVK